MHPPAALPAPLLASSSREPAEFLPIGLLALVLLHGFFVAAELAFVKVRKTQLELAQEQGDRRASTAARILSQLDDYLATTQFGVTLTSLALGWFGSTYLAHLLRPVLAPLAPDQWWLTQSAAFLLAFSTLAFAHMTLGALIPKSLAIRHALPAALALAHPLTLFHSLARPLIRLPSLTAKALLRHLLKTEPALPSDPPASEDELRVILEESPQPPGDTPIEREILRNALDMKNLVACDIMTPRSDVVFLDLNAPFEDQVSLAIQSRHTRFPLCRGHLDDSLGLVHIKDLLALVREGNRDLASVKRELHHVSEIMPLEKLLRFFLSKRAHLAVVVDEYGSALGIVTLDNVLEELVGSIQDEFDAGEKNPVRHINDSEFEVDGAMPLYELRELLGEELDSSEASTIGGYLTYLLGHIPQTGQSLEIAGHRATVTASNPRRVLRVHFQRLQPLPTSSEKKPAPPATLPPLSRKTQPPPPPTPPLPTPSNSIP